MTIHRRKRLIHRRRSAVGLGLVAAISFLAGMTDAIGLLTVGDFVSFMSGNTTRAAVAVADGNFGRAALLCVGLLSFVLGNAAGIMAATRLGMHGLLICVSFVLALAALVPDAHSWGFVLLIFAMGGVNATVEQVEGLPIGLTYVTGALSRFGRGLGRWAMGARSNIQWVAHIVPWSGMMAGALTGAVLQRYNGNAALWAPVAVSILLSCAAFAVPRRWSNRLVPRPPLP